MSGRSVGGSRVVGARESRVQGEGSQGINALPVDSTRSHLHRRTEMGNSNEDDKSGGNTGSGTLILGEPDAVKACAMSRTEGIAITDGRSSRQMTPRRTTYLTLKGRGDRSMFVKRGVTEDVYGVALQRLSDTAKAGLPEPQCPGAEPSRSSVARLYADAHDSSRLTFRRGYALVRGRWLVKPFKGMSAEPTSLSSFHSDGTWDGLRGASPTATESP
jgi:hypothetical protein